MMPATVVAIALCVVQADARVPDATRPEPPRTATDALLRVALTEVLKEPHEGLPPRRGPVLLRTDGPHVSARILPRDTAPGIALVSAEQLRALATAAGPGRFYYLTMQVTSMDASEAIVYVRLLPAVAEGQTAFCCWSTYRRYVRTTTGWTFDRVVGGGVM
jgi:hypothetical protein